MITTASTILTSCLMLVQLVQGLPSTTPQRKSASDGAWIPPPAAALNLQLLQQLKKNNSLQAMPFSSDERVVIGSSWPSAPPMSLRFVESSGISEATPNASRIDKRSLRSLHPPLWAQSLSSSSSLVSACASESRWVQLTEVEDLWENRVTVVQQFDNGGTRMNQYFHETICTRPTGASSDRPPSCTGTDTVNYDSVCLEKYVYAYAKVYYAREREERWTFVKIRASCNCAVIRKNSRRSRRSQVKG